MKYFNPSYWFKLWVLSAPLFNDKTQGINAKSIDNKKIKDWASKNTTDISLIENQEITLSKNQTFLLNLPSWNSNLTTHNQHNNQENIINNEINYQQTDNLEELNRPKRENNNKLDSWTCFLCPRRLSIEISHNNWEKIRIEHNIRTRNSLYNFVYNLFKIEFENINNLENTDIEILSNIVCDKFNDIDNIFKYKNNNDIGLIIRTNRESYWNTSDNWWGVHLNKEVTNNNYNGNELNFSGTRGSVDLFYLYFTFKPEFWEEVRFLYNKYKKINDINSFADEFKEKAFNHKDSWIYYIVHMEKENSVRFCKSIWMNWDSIDNLWQNSNRRNRIKLVGYFSATTEVKNIIYSKEILDDENYRENKYLDNLQRDFTDWNKDEINLGIFNNDNAYDDIKSSIREKYSNLIINDDEVEIVPNKSYSNFCKCLKIKIKIKDSSEKYSNGLLSPKFSYVTQTKLNEISNIIANHDLTKQWIEHINDYNKNLPTKIEHLKKFTDSQKWTHKIIEKEIIKSYIRDWSQISTLIEHELKLDELNKNVQGLKTSFDSIKNQINDLDERVKNLEQPKHCESTASAVSGIVALAPIPVLQEVSATVSIISTGVAAICSL